MLIYLRYCIYFYIQKKTESENKGIVIIKFKID